MTDKGDKIFQLSLTEIAFILVFILMFLLGSMVFLAQKKNEELLAKMASADGFDQQLAQLVKAEALLKEEIALYSLVDPKDVITQLVAESVSRNELAKLKKILEEYQEKITALSEIQGLIEKTAGDGTDSIMVQKKIEDALRLAARLRKKINDKRQAEGATETIENLSVVGEEAERSIDNMSTIEIMLANKAINAISGTNALEKIESLTKEYLAYEAIKAGAENTIALKRENTNLKGQMAFLKKSLEAKGGMDFPPGWADENGKAQMLLNVELRDDELDVSRAWPESRDEDARGLPNIQTVMSTPVSDYATFLRAVKPISDLSRKQDCRHYVRLKNTVQNAVISDRRRLSVEDHFYKLEIRR